MRRCSETTANRVLSPVSVASTFVTGGHLPSSPSVKELLYPQLSTAGMSGCNMRSAWGGVTEMTGDTLHFHLKCRLQERCTHYTPFLGQSVYKTQVSLAPNHVL